MNIFEKSQWIWIKKGADVDEYAEFCDKLEYYGGKASIRLSCDSDYTLYINEQYVASNQYGDYEHYKIYDEIEISNYLKEGENNIEILVHYFGENSQRYKVGKGGLIYEVICDNSIIAYSSEKTLSRKSPTYISGRKIRVSSQLGFTFSYDSTKETKLGYDISGIVEKSCTFYPRPIKKQTIKDRQKIKSIKVYSDSHYLIDLGTEIVGLPTLEIVSENEADITVAYGEHIEDGCVRKTIYDRNFYYEYKAKKGHNQFTNYMLRLACRYLEVFSNSPIEIKYVGVLPQIYEIEENECKIESALDRKIYDICVNTLKLCMMEHYVDCPWREQALYAFDSRNQMLCGYYVFKDGNKDYARANLKLIGQDRRNDGLLSICYPCGTSLAIPSFSLYYILQMKEYIDYTRDTSLSGELYEKMCLIIDEFLKNSPNGLINKFSGDEMWNFYDWSPFLSGSLGVSQDAKSDLIINCLFIIALDCLEQISGHIGKSFNYISLAQNLRLKIRNEFLTNSNTFTVHRNADEITVLGNSLAILAKVATKEEAHYLCEKIINGQMHDCSLSMKIFEYEALLYVNSEKYKAFVLNDIRTNYKKMLDYGSDTVWETIDGPSAFDNAGSLCHGWSAIPVYIFHKLGIAKKEGERII
ncbi:MAG: family 78 glycoside hydrolase catalytic domain [Clostridia bacterium]|nr:family 78 glycoside hydrolase catalytic domain [Clostridia bacterium]